MSAIMNKFIPDLSKLEPLGKTNYRRYFQKMVIFFEQLEVDYVFFNPPITEKAEDSTTIFRDSDIDATTKDKFDKENKMLDTKHINAINALTTRIKTNHKHIWLKIQMR
ncbi:hypothetical protein GOBAR_DD21031 [Gossypium barbadense]|nr:hypothetical protein GOBAR_DD21031 [Gossypium barbadense]